MSYKKILLIISVFLITLIFGFSSAELEDLKTNDTFVEIKVQKPICKKESKAEDDVDKIAKIPCEIDPQIYRQSTPIVKTEEIKDVQ